MARSKTSLFDQSAPDPLMDKVDRRSSGFEIMLGQPRAPEKQFRILEESHRIASFAQAFGVGFVGSQDNIQAQMGFIEANDSSGGVLPHV